MLSIDLTGQTALVTGGGAGIGRACVQALQVAGARVIAVDLAFQTEDHPDVAIKGDITSTEVRQQALNEIAGSKKVVLVNNAGIQYEKRLSETSEAEISRIFEVNVIATMLMTKEFAAVAPSGGSIVNLASVLGLSGDAGLAAYTATKGAVVNFTRTSALEYAGRFRVNGVLPGAVRTPLTTRSWDLTGDAANAEQRMGRIYPVGRIGEPSEVGNVVAFLASDLASFINGALLTVDGGLLAANAEWGLDRL